MNLTTIIHKNNYKHTFKKSKTYREFYNKFSFAKQVHSLKFDDLHLKQKYSKIIA